MRQCRTKPLLSGRVRLQAIARSSLILATQTLSRLDRLTGAQQTRDLRAAVFSNLDGLFAFHTSAEDAHFLADELGGRLDEQDLLELGHYQCYARATDVRTGERLPAFTVQLEPPPTGDSKLAAEVAFASADRYGRDAIEVDLDRQSAIARVDGGRRRGGEASNADPTPMAGHGESLLTGLLAADRTVSGGELPRSSPRQSSPHRAKKDKRNGRSSIDGSGSDGMNAATDDQTIDDR